MLAALLAMASLLPACSDRAPPPPQPRPADIAAEDRREYPIDPAPAPEPPPPHVGPGGDGAPGQAGPAPLAAGLIRARWAVADNRAHCAPIAFASDAGAPGTARAANFGGGWGVAFDLPGLRSAYGIAGTGSLPDDRQPPQWWRDRLRTQWPLMIDLPDLPPPAFSGYGLDGARAYAADNPEGRGEHSGAYVRIGGQDCLYNVWSRISRAHLESLLLSMRML